MRALTLAAALIVGGAAAAANAAPAAAHRGLVDEGDLTRADFERYRAVPVHVPAGVERVTVHLDYDKAAHTVVDLGLWDPARFRGWSGGTRDTVTLAATDASPGYLPGPLPAGIWQVMLGVPNIRAGVTAHYRITLAFDRPEDPAADRPATAAAAVLPVGRGPGWYRGDLHMHDANSDGSCATRAGPARVPCPLFRTVEAAAAAGLDFIAVTDHNTVAHFGGLRELQPWFDHLLLIPGIELTTFRGHANAIGANRFIDFRIAGRSGMPALQDEVAAAGALLSINHPALPSGEACMGCGWTWPDVDWSRVAAIEAINGAIASGPLAGTGFWYARLDEGHRITGIAGSDNHDPDAPAGKPAIGHPTTVVHAASLDTAAILAGIKAGNVFIDVDGTRDRLLEVTASDEAGRVAMGGTLAGHGEITVSAHVKGAKGFRASLVVDGRPGANEQLVDSDDTTLTFRMPHAAVTQWLLVTVADGGRPRLIGNPVFIRSARGTADARAATPAPTGARPPR